MASGNCCATAQSFQKKRNISLSLAILGAGALCLQALWKPQSWRWKALLCAEIGTSALAASFFHLRIEPIKKIDPQNLALQSLRRIKETLKDDSAIAIFNQLTDDYASNRQQFDLFFMSMFNKLEKPLNNRNSARAKELQAQFAFFKTSHASIKIWREKWQTCRSCYSADEISDLDMIYSFYNVALLRWANDLAEWLSLPSNAPGNKNLNEYLDSTFESGREHAIFSMGLKITLNADEEDTFYDFYEKKEIAALKSQIKDISSTAPEFSLLQTALKSLENPTRANLLTIAGKNSKHPHKRIAQVILMAEMENWTRLLKSEADLDPKTLLGATIRDDYCSRVLQALSVNDNPYSLLIPMALVEFSDDGSAQIHELLIPTVDQKEAAPAFTTTKKKWLKKE